MTAHQCPHCGKSFGDANAVFSHSKVKHPRLKRPPRPIQDDDESFADRAIAAHMARAMGEYSDDDWLIEGEY